LTTILGIRRLDEESDLADRSSVAKNVECPDARLINYLLNEKDPIQSKRSLLHMFFNPELSLETNAAPRVTELNAYVCANWAWRNNLKR
jgi:hypothetical protein